MNDYRDDDFNDLLDGADEPGEKRPERPEIDDTLALLREGTEPTNAALTYGLSGMSLEEMEQVASLWSTLDADYRARLVQSLASVAETNPDLDYSGMAYIALYDETDESVISGIEMLWDSDSLGVMTEFMKLAQQHPSMQVRAAAAGALGQFILQGELGGADEDDVQPALELAFVLWNDVSQPVEVRRRALEALSNSSDDRVNPAIGQAYRSDDERMQLGALYAMGRSCDTIWNDAVLKELRSDDPEFQYEAARAAGELLIEEAVPLLSEMALGSDVDVRDTAIWSLGEIGGREALRVLNLVADEARSRRDTDLLEAVEDAIASASLGGNDLFMMRFDD
jgi:HEAT repeat protein